MENNLMGKIVALCKRRGFIYPGSDIYGGVANTYDYGPMGVELLRNIRNLWWKHFVHKRSDMVGLDASLISHQDIWKASGHTTGFADALIDCRNCKARFRVDHVIEDYLEDPKNKEHIKLWTENLTIGGDTKLTNEIIAKVVSSKKVEGLSLEQLSEIMALFEIHCRTCGKYKWVLAPDQFLIGKNKEGDFKIQKSKPRKFNLLFPVHLGIVEGDQDLAYLRGETAQGMFVNFKNVLDSTRVRLPFGIAQLGKSFRNEITPGQSVFRTLEFEQGEIEYFFDPENSDWEKLFEEWKNTMLDFVVDKLGIKEENLRWREHTGEERSFYSKRTEDLEYKFPFGFKELWGLAYRTDYDLTQHIHASKKDLSITDPQTGKKTVPHVIEPAVGINRLFLMILCDAYGEEEKRVVLKIDPRLAPVKTAVFPLVANKPEIMQKAQSIYKDLKAAVNGLIVFDDRGNIGKRYLSQDEVGTPYCITIDHQTLEDNTVTVRERNTTTQQRLAIDSLEFFIKEKTS